MSFRLDLIKPKDKWNKSKFNLGGEIRNIIEFRLVAPARQEFFQTYNNWDHKPVESLNRSSNRAEYSAKITIAGDEYYWVTVGTKPHDVNPDGGVFIPFEYRPRTRKRELFSGESFRSDNEFFTDKPIIQSIEAREFHLQVRDNSKERLDNIGQELADKITGAIVSGSPPIFTF